MGLVEYESSDEEVEDVQTQPEPQNQPTKAVASETQQALQQGPTTSSSQPSTTEQLPDHKASPTLNSDASQNAESQPPLGPVLGPALGPSRPPDAATLPEPDDEQDIDMSFLNDPAAPPRSPYSANRAVLHDLTLPTIPNLEIPPSPPGSPPPGLDALTAKFDNFLRLKREKGIHFNHRLIASQGLRNPSLTENLVKFAAGVETEFVSSDTNENNFQKATEQYATTLSSDVWNPAAFPTWAYKDELWRIQQNSARERERVRGEPVEFVPSTGSVLPNLRDAASGQAGSSRLPGTGKRKGRF
ncbi:HCNGP-like protein-domain-containing protein [Podospora australis]|uniref:HCNGP-like protein-domain-containing protein n=1 Tax=Podospora australis TaxID=1536484 RepID=A0AAN7AK66_9PEZI|nr:HCNGP-like protein-domain-containing protein [Podospora australis]